MIAVVGGGLIGSAIAFTLSRAGAEVVVLDAEKPGAAWRAGAGMLTPTGERLAGTPLDALARESLRLWPDFARRLEAATGQAVPLRWGVEHVGYGAAASLPSPATCRQDEATTHPPSVVRAARLGLDLRRAEVLGLEPLRADVRLLTSAGALTAEQVVLAAVAWSGRFGLPVFPVRGQALLLDSDGSAPLLARYTAKGHTVSSAGFPLYGLPRPDGHYVGATVRPHRWEAQPLAADARWLGRAARGVWPESGRLTPRQALVGLRPCTPDGLPIVGPLPGWGGQVVAATGHGRHGAPLAPLAAQQVAQVLL
ncbi:NAD(P)/FAD-dependent oxidoreductase [Deinococcus sp. Marseille-Q6407]|uniref:NAD(P)/FAD-dependent oxidoreductase n=1 Tax=Deinococcus sp. Marseille-Q6407 TaxID=2969223 RepID=UPI0021BE5400|nr:FAD-dependent oxidoreductase [Deinococcus sp. Marseille-Q6407]